MYTSLNVIALLIGIVIVVSIIWGLASRRRSLPCPVWLRWMVELDNPFTRTNRAHVIIEHLDIKAGMKILDAGCGPGRLTIPLAKAVGPTGRIIAMDIQAGMLKRVQEKVKQHGLTNVEFLESGIGENHLQSNAFDRVVLVTVLGEIQNRERGLTEIYNALKPHGVLSVTEIIFDPRFQRRSTVVGLAKPIGFREKSFYGNSIAYTMHLEKL